METKLYSIDTAGMTKRCKKNKKKKTIFQLRV